MSPPFYVEDHVCDASNGLPGIYSPYPANLSWPVLKWSMANFIIDSFRSEPSLPVPVPLGADFPVLDVTASVLVTLIYYDEYIVIEY